MGLLSVLFFFLIYVFPPLHCFQYLSEDIEDLSDLVLKPKCVIVVPLTEILSFM